MAQRGRDPAAFVGPWSIRVLSSIVATEDPSGKLHRWGRVVLREPDSDHDFGSVLHGLEGATKSSTQVDLA